MDILKEGINNLRPTRGPDLWVRELHLSRLMKKPVKFRLFLMTICLSLSVVALAGPDKPQQSQMPPLKEGTPWTDLILNKSTEDRVSFYKRMKPKSLDFVILSLAEENSEKPVDQIKNIYNEMVSAAPLNPQETLRSRLEFVFKEKVLPYGFPAHCKAGLTLMKILREENSRPAYLTLRKLASKTASTASGNILGNRGQLEVLSSQITALANGMLIEHPEVDIPTTKLGRAIRACGNYLKNLRK